MMERCSTSLWKNSRKRTCQRGSQRAGCERRGSRRGRKTGGSGTRQVSYRRSPNGRTNYFPCGFRLLHCLEEVFSETRLQLCECSSGTLRKKKKKNRGIVMPRLGPAHWLKLASRVVSPS